MASSSIHKSIVLDPPLEPFGQRLANLGNSLCENRPDLKHSLMLESMQTERVKTLEVENPEEEYK